MKIEIKANDETAQKALVIMKQSFVGIKAGGFVLPSAIMGKHKEQIKLLKRTKMIANKETPNVVVFEFDDKRASDKKKVIQFAEVFFSQMRVSRKSYEVIAYDE